MRLKRAYISLLLAVIFVLAYAFPAMALTVADYPADRHEYKETIEMVWAKDGTLAKIQYNVTNTGATSGIRYRTAKITFDVGGHFSGEIDALALRGAKPEPGQKTVSVITITVDDLAQVLQVPADQVEDFKRLASTPGVLRVGAVIEIYNAATGEVLDTITSRDQIQSVTSKWGFDRGSIEDMYSRFKGGEHQNAYSPPGGGNPAGGGGSSSNGGTGQGNAELALYARSRGGQDIRGNYVPPEDRPPGTAKYADVVKAVLRIYQPELPKSLQKLGAVIDWWRVDGATVSYPKRAPDFTFSHFVDPVGTVTVNMNYLGGQIEDAGPVEATAEFEEDWSVAGAPIHDMLTDRDAPPPTEYPITAAYKTTVHYHYYVSEEGDSKPTRVDGEISVNGNVTANLLVNGTGINIL